MIALVSLYCQRKNAGEYGFFLPAVMVDEGEGKFYKVISELFITPDLRKRFLADATRRLEEERICAKRILKFFGKSVIDKLAKKLLEKPHGIMLQKELDAMLEPKLSTYHKKHKIRDLMKIA